MDFPRKRRKVLGALVLAITGVVLVSVLLARPAARPRGRSTGDLSQVLIVPQPTSPVQIVSVTQVAPRLTAGTPADIARNSRAFSVVLRNGTSQDVIVYALQLTTAKVAQKAAPQGGKCQSHFAGGDGDPALGAGQTRSDLLNAVTYEGPLAVRIDFVLLADGTAFGANMSGALTTFQDDISTRDDVERWILTTLQQQGPEATEKLLKEQLARLDAQVAKYLTPDWVQ